MRKIDEMQNEFEVLKKEAQTLLDHGKIEEAKAKVQEVKNKKSAIEIQSDLDAEELERLAEDVKEKQKADEQTVKIKETANAIRALIKKATGVPLTEKENALLLPTPTQTTGEYGEKYILPEDVSTLIHKKIRQYRSLRDVVGYIPTSALTGSFPIEDFETVSELIDFADGTDGTEANDVRFKNVSFALKEKAAFVKLSNTLIQLTDNALVSYIAEVFAKKAIITENKLILDTLKSNKTVKTLGGWQDLRTSTNVDLDPAVLFGTVIVTNQDGFDFLDKQLDGTGRPILQPNPANPTQKMFNGYTVHVYSNRMLPSVKNKAPIIYGNLNEAVKFVDLNGQISFATSSEAGFMSNTTIARLIEFIDVVQCDKSDKCYIYGELGISAASTGSN